MSMQLADVKHEVAVGTRILAALGLASGVRAGLGHVSMRLPGDPNRFVVKGRGYAIDSLATVKAQDLVTCDLEGCLIDGPSAIIPCFEVQIHSAIYKARPDVQSVVHAHPKFTTILSVLEKRIVPVCFEGNRLVREPLPVYRHQKLVLSEEDGRELATSLGAEAVVLMFGHGATTTGKTVEESVTSMIHLEHQAEMNYHACAIAGLDHPHVPDALIQEGLGSWGSMNQFGAQYELPHFKQAVAKAGMPKHNGVWGYWSQLVSRDL
jgi:ribulose-5-phosphate 4-epimerase/fuculose-1-phosphate aldolase